MARIFDGAGDRVIHDDRLVLRRETTGWVMHNTPVYRNDEPRSALLEHLWIIRHGTARNVFFPEITETAGQLRRGIIRDQGDIQR